MTTYSVRSPNFIVGGTSAGGTSFLSAVLVQHPEIYLPKEMRPEPHFFYKSWEYEKGTEYYLSRWFSEVPDSAVAVGERSSSYIFGGTATAEKFHKFNPGLKFVFTLRNPIERTWANYRYTVLQGLEDLSFEEALEREPQRVAAQEGIWAEIQPYNYTGRGFYADQLEQFTKFYPLSQILCIKSESLSKNTREELRKVYKFLNLTNLDFEAERPSDHTSVSVIDPSLQKRLRTYFDTKFDKVIEACRKNEGIKQYIQNKQDEENILLLEKNLTGAKAQMSEKARTYLTQVFAEDMKKLRAFVDFDYSDWK